MFPRFSGTLRESIRSTCRRKWAIETEFQSPFLTWLQTPEADYDTNIMCGCIRIVVNDHGNEFTQKSFICKGWRLFWRASDCMGMSTINTRVAGVIAGILARVVLGVINVAKELRNAYEHHVGGC